ncbi:MAG: serine hydroxymethyltransferase, partial [Pseudomonadota bacterium]
FKDYTAQVIRNAQAMAQAAEASGLAVISGGTETHLALIDLRPKGVKGNATEQALERAYITCNKNGVPFDPEKPAITSGIRVGSPAGTTRGFGEAEFTQIGNWIGEIVDGLSTGGDTTDLEGRVRSEVMELTSRFPIYNGLGA